MAPKHTHNFDTVTRNPFLLRLEDVKSESVNRNSHYAFGANKHFYFAPLQYKTIYLTKFIDCLEGLTYNQQLQTAS